MKNDNNHLQPGRCYTWRRDYRSGILALLLLAFGFAQAQPVVTPGITPICANNDGAVTLSVTGGTSGTYYYSLYNTSTGASWVRQTSPTFTGLGAGSYYAYVQGADSAYSTFSIGRKVTLNASVTDATCPSASGSITAVPVNATSPYNFHWDNGSTAATITGLGAGFSSVTVTDANGCTASRDTLEVHSISPVTAHITSSGSACSPVLSANITGATGAVSYLWTGGSTASTLTIPATGTYHLTATDVNGCSAEDNIYITAGGLSLDTTAFSYADCRGNNGLITIHARNGSGPYTYAWSNGATTASVANLSVGPYQVTVTDATGCAGIDYLYIVQNDLNLSVAGGNYNYCGQPNANLTAYPSYDYDSIGGAASAAYSYVWSNGSTTANVTNLTAGTYRVTVTDGVNGCTATATSFVRDTTTLNAYIFAQNPSCGASDGTLNIQAYGGQPNYSVLWSTGSIYDSITHLAAGTYTVTVTDVLGCSRTFSRTLTGYSNITTSVTATPSSCDTSQYTGTAIVTVTGGGIAPYTYQWYERLRGGASGLQGPVIGTADTLKGLYADELVYVIVTDASGCAAANLDSAEIRLDPICYDHITGYLYLDTNGNCTRDAGEPAQTNAYIYASTGSNSYWASPDATGYYDITVLPGTYTVGANPYTYGSCSAATCTAGYTVSFTSSAQTATGQDFGISSGATFDLAVSIGYQGTAPGTQRQYTVNYYNWGQTTVSNGVVTFVYDTALVLSGATIPAYTSHNATTHTITWNVGSVSPTTWSTPHQLTVNLDIPATVSLGTAFDARAEISPTANDCYTANNYAISQDSARGSYDPNDKEVSPSGNLSANDTVLTYTIRFQNTGNAPATRVVLKDTLSSNVSIASLRLGASSHPYDFSLSGSGILTFTFAPIYLPDSSHGDSSRGYVTYTVETKKNLPLFSQVKNTAFIYFDANPAIVTNTTVSTRSDFATGIRSLYTAGELAVSVSPNPVQDKGIVHISGADGAVQFDLTDVRGQKVMEASTTDPTLTLEASMFSPGLYLYTARDAAGHLRSGKVLIAH